MRITTCPHKGNELKTRPIVFNLVSSQKADRRSGQFGEKFLNVTALLDQQLSILADTTYQVLMARMQHSMTTRGISS